MIRGVLLILAIVIALLAIWYLPLVTYGVKQGIGQLNVVYSARNIEEVKQDPSVPDSIKAGLSLVREIVDFGVEKIGLQDEGNYQQYFDQEGKPILFVVTAAEPFALKPYEWKFPVVGTVPYKGFFDPDDAEKEKQRLLDKGYDVSVRNPGGWSTLGWFKDPVLSNMLARSKGDLANVILHELTHATVFVKDSIEYNENLATFIGDEATLLFLLDKYGHASPEWIKYNSDEADWKKFTAHILRGADKLDSLYNSIDDMPENKKEHLKAEVISEIMTTTDTISFFNPYRFQWNKEVIPNNAYFMSFLRYRAKQDNFKSILQEDFNNNLESFVRYLKEKYN